MATNSGLTKYFSREHSKAADVTYIGVDAQLQGEIKLQSGALIAGQLQGVLRSTSHVKVELSGVIEGDIYCKELKVCGVVKGRVFCDKLIIVSSGVVDGSLACQQMEIYDGGQFIGTRTSAISQEVAQESLVEKGVDITQTLEEALVTVAHETKSKLSSKPKTSDSSLNALNLAS
ncbi:polymer-forming cytoskeletal protein [Shewanella sp.]|uniref:polymer-forming cytoskeletal protein n=1 Tax=Shewanella sp. TaxID=50422 RepID=UPI0040542D23